MATDVTTVDNDSYWVELQEAQGERKSWQTRKDWKRLRLPRLTLMVHNWTEVTDLAVKGSLTATLTLYDVDSTETRKGGAGTDEPIAKIQIKLKNTAAGIAASVVKRKEVLDRSLREYYVRRGKNLADFEVRIGRRTLMFRLPRTDLHDELANGTLEVGFTLEEGDRIYNSIPPHKTPATLTVSEPIADMLALKDRFSDPARKPKLETANAAAKHEGETLKRINAKTADSDVDGLRIEKLLDGSKSRRALIASLLDDDDAMSSKTRGEFTGETDPWLPGTHNVLDQEWTDGDIVKAYFVIHDYGIQTNNRKKLHYRAEAQRIRWKVSKSKKKKYQEVHGADKDPPHEKKYYTNTAVHGFLNWGGVYAPAWEFWRMRQGTGASFNPTPYWAAFTIEIETAPLPFYRPGPNDMDELVKKLSSTTDQPDGWLPTKLEKGMDRTEADQDYPLACMNWKYPFGWPKRKTLAADNSKPKPKKKGEIAFMLGAAPKSLIDGLVDLYLLASCRAGHLLTVTTHVEVDRAKPGSHADPSGINLDVFYDAITQRISKTGTNRLAGFGGLEIPLGVRYGQHPQRLTGKPIKWKGIPLARQHAGNKKLKFSTFFPQQSTLPTKK